MALNIVLCLVGFVLLYYGAEWLVKGSSSLARSLGVTSHGHRPDRGGLRHLGPGAGGQRRLLRQGARA